MRLLTERARMARARWRAPVAVVGALALVAGTAAVAAPGDGATVFACTNNLRQSIHFVEADEACEAGETLMTWNRQGPAGPAGATGPAGPPGERGTQGEPGLALQRSQQVDAALSKADRTFSKRPRKPPKQVIAQLQAADAEPGEARAAFRDGPVPLRSALASALGALQPDTPPVVASLALPPGNWVVHAKAQAVLTYDVHKAVIAAGATYDTISCQLRAGVDTDESAVAGFSGSLALEVVHRFALPGLVQLECYGLLEPKLTDIKLTAVHVSKLKNQAVAG